MEMKKTWRNKGVVSTINPKSELKIKNQNQPEFSLRFFIFNFSTATSGTAKESPGLERGFSEGPKNSGPLDFKVKRNNPKSTF